MTVPINIYPFKTGLDTDLEPWLLPEDGFTELNNINVKHGFLQKRSGYNLFSTLSTGGRVMGILQYVTSTNTRQTIAFDQTRGFYYDSGSGTFLNLNSGNAIFSSSDTDYVVGNNYQAGTTTISANRLYFTNGKASDSGSAPTLDGLWYYNGSSTVTAQVAQINATDYMWGAKLVFSLNDRILVLNTFEGSASASNFPQRARWTSQSNPDDWSEAAQAGAGHSDAATGEHIISAHILQNDLLVFFTSSVWLLRTTYGATQPFRWERLNDFRSCMGKMSSVAYDRYALAIGERGISASDGIQTRRVDDRIEDFASTKINLSEKEKVFCARSYNNRRFIALYPSGVSTENDSALVYDDESAAFSTYSISLNCMGYGNRSAYRFNSFTTQTFDSFGEDTWISPQYQEGPDIFLGGNTSGSIYVLESTGSDNLDPIEATFTTASWNPFKDQNQECKMAFVDLYIETDPKTEAEIFFYKDSENYAYASQDIDFLPPNMDYVCQIIGATNASPCVVNAPSHGLSTGDVIYIYGVEGIDINSGEQASSYTITVVDTNHFSLDGIDTSASDPFTDEGSVYRNEFYRTKTWKRVYAGGTGFQHRMRFVSGNSSNPFKIHGMKPHFKPVGRRLVN